MSRRVIELAFWWFILLLVLGLSIAWPAIAASRCDGTVVRGAFGYKCIETTP